MDTDFDKWNELKKNIEKQVLSSDLFFHEREIWWSSIGKNIGVEANGKHDTFERPVLILRVFNRDMIWILPITSTTKDSPFYYRFRFNNEHRSVILTQIRVISSKRLLRKVDIMSDENFEMIKESMKSLFKAKPLQRRGISEP